MMKLCGYLVLSLGILPAAATAGEAWKMIYEDAHVSVYADTASFDRQDKRVSFREREYLLQPKVDSASMRMIQEIQYRRQADCTGRRLRALSRAVFSVQGTMMYYEATRPEAVSWESPQSEREVRLLETVCGVA